MVLSARSTFSHRILALLLLVGLGLSNSSYATRSFVHAAASNASSDRDTLSIGWGTETKTLDPVNGPQNPDIWVIVNIYDQLVRVANDGKTIQPDLATSWTVSGRGTVYTFHLRPGVVFHNGMKLTAADVRFCLDRARQKQQLWSWTLSAVKKVDVPSSSTVRITLKHPWAPFLSDVSLFDAGVYPAAYFKRVGASFMTTHPIGTGPYMFEQWKRGQYLRLKKNPRYWLASRFPMQRVEYDLIPNDNTRLLKVEAGELDVDNVLPYNLISQVQRSNSAQVLLNASTQTNYIIFNTRVKPLGDLKVRQAISHAIDRAALVKAVVFGHGAPANSFVPRGAIDYDPNIPVPEHDLGVAKRLLRQSSAPHGFTMTMEVSSGDSVQNAVAVIFKSELAPLGITLNLRQIDPTTLFNDEQVGKYHIGQVNWTNDIPDPDELVSSAVDYSQGTRSFYTWYNNPQLITLSHRAQQSDDAAIRKRLYFKIQELWARDVPFVALYYAPFVNAVNKRVQGFSEMPLGYFVLQGVHKS